MTVYWLLSNGKIICGYFDIEKILKNFFGKFWFWNSESIWLTHFSKIGLRKWNFLMSRNFFSWIWTLKIDFRIITKNHAADSKIGSGRKIDFRADRTHESHPTAWELKTVKRLFDDHILMSIYSSGIIYSKFVNPSVVKIFFWFARIFFFESNFR